ncbi:glycosyltransferase family 39 protein, partial [bacterium]|nr:glycosyltransferase family 39 protein [bacterium]
IDTMLACLLTIFAYYFILLIEDTRYWIHAGIALGLACITKYPAFIALALPVAGLFLFPQRRKYIFSALFIAFLIFLPWGYRIASVYGTAAFSEEHCEEIAKIMVLAKKWFFPCATGFAGLIFLLKFRNRFCKFIRAKYIRLIVVSCLICICLYSAYCRQHILAFLNPFHIPRNGDTARFFYYDPWYFYILRIIELAPVHLFFYCTLFTGYLFRCKPEVILLSVYALLYLAAMMIWQNPQCRYILPCIPLITVVDALCIQRIGTLTSKKVKAGLIIASAYVLFKTVWVGWNIAVPNNACYF